MSDSTKVLEEILERRLLEVPDYQRAYAWEKRQLEEFWEDLELIEAGGSHYTGTLVLREAGKVEDENRHVQLRRCHVVDGQQRLTTCVLLMDHILDERERLEDGEALSDRRRLLIAKINGEEKPRLQLGADINEHWSAVILGGGKTVQPPNFAAQRRLSTASAFFRQKLEEHLKDQDSKDQLESLRRLFAKVTNSLHFSLYEVGDDAQVGVIFETLNQRGKPLTELEKVKNYLLFLASRLPEGAAQELATKVNNSFSQIFANLGDDELRPHHEDQLLRAHWLTTHDPDARHWQGASSIKTAFHRRRYLGSGQPGWDLLREDVKEYSESLSQASYAYRDIVLDSASAFKRYGMSADEIRQASKRLREAGPTAVFTPLLIAARLRFPDQGENYLGILDLCERYSVRVYMIMERRSNAGQTRLFTLGHELYKDAAAASTPEEGTALIDCIRSAIAERIIAFASDSEVEARLLNSRMDWYAKPGHKFFLFEYELSLLQGNPPIFPYETFTGKNSPKTTEHILPQHPVDAYWITQFPSPEERAELTHALGNLVLTRDNSSYGRRPFPQKRDGIDASGAAYTRSNMKQEQELGHVAAWDPSAIQERQRCLAAWAMKRWALPPDVLPAPPTIDNQAIDVDDSSSEPSLEIS